MKKKIFLLFSLLLLIGGGCELLPSPDENPSLLDLEEQVAEEEVEQDNIAPKPLEENKKTQEQNLIYSRKEYLLKFIYPKGYEITQVGSIGNEKIRIKKKELGDFVGDIDVKFLDTDEWENEEYSEVTNKTPILVKEENRYKGKWAIYYLSNYQGHLFTISCMKTECPVILQGIYIDETLGELDKDFFIGDWSVEGGEEFDEITLNKDGTFSALLQYSPYDSGGWSFDGKTLKLDSDEGEKYDLIFTNISIGEGGDWMILYAEDLTWTWRME